MFRSFSGLYVNLTVNQRLVYGINVDNNELPIIPENRELFERKLHGTDERESSITERKNFGMMSWSMLAM